MNDKINTYKPCDEHESTHSEHCEKCETAVLRGLLREVANSFHFAEVACEPAAVMVRLKAELWEKIKPLRNGVSHE